MRQDVTGLLNHNNQRSDNTLFFVCGCLDDLNTWNRGVTALRAAVDRRECRRVKISYEFKPTDASSRFAVVPSTGAALLLVRDVDRPGRFGLTLDAGHLMVGIFSLQNYVRSFFFFPFQSGDHPSPCPPLPPETSSFSTSYQSAFSRSVFNYITYACFEAPIFSTQLHTRV